MAKKRKKKPVYIDKPELHQDKKCPCEPAIFCDLEGHFELMHKRIKH